MIKWEKYRNHIIIGAFVLCILYFLDILNYDKVGSFDIEYVLAFICAAGIYACYTSIDQKTAPIVVQKGQGQQQGIGLSEVTIHDVEQRLKR